MAVVTPLFKHHDQLPDLAPRFDEDDELPWKPTPSEGIDILPPSETVQVLPMPAAIISCTARGSQMAYAATFSSPASRMPPSTVMVSMVPPLAALS